MANPIPLAKRRAIVKAYKKGSLSLKEVMAKFEVSKPSVLKFMRMDREHASLKPKSPHGAGRSTVLSEDDFPLIRQLVADFPQLNQSELHRLFCKRANKTIGRTTFLRYLLSLNGRPQHTAHFKKEHVYAQKSGPERERYPSDLSDQEWEHIKDDFEPEKKRRPCLTPKREIVNAIFYQCKTGCQWRYLPRDFPNWNLVAKHFYRWKRLGVWELVNEKLRRLVRIKEQKNEEPSACIIDSQSVKTTEPGGPKGYDGAKKVSGRKRHIVVDTLGQLLEVKVHEANIQDGAGLERVVDSSLKKNTQEWS